ncbi:MAG: aminotransferase class I/II-fold pyridoxal phosphate-dependent enzyme [Gemmatimonadota bacterium]
MNSTPMDIPDARTTVGFEPPRRIRAFPSYPLAHIPRVKARLLAEGRSVLDLGVGDPGLPVPEVAVEELARAAADPSLQRYGFQRGLPAFRTAVSEWMEERFGVRVDAERELLPLIGSKEGIAHLAFAALDPGDTALVPDPCYAAYFGGSLLAGAEVVRVPLRREDGFLVPPEVIRSAPGRLRLVYLNYPNNPTTAVADAPYLADVVAACRDRGAILVYDNAYSEIAFDGFRPPGLLEVEGGREIGVEFHSFSKTYNMTGWRLGWMCGSEAIVRALTRIKTFFDTGTYLPIQAAGVAVLRAAARFIPRNVERLRERRDAAMTALSRIGLDVDVPRATLYLWILVPTPDTAEDFCRRVLERAGVVLMPGSAMGRGGEGYVRAALTLPPDRYEEAADRIASAL